MKKCIYCKLPVEEKEQEKSVLIPCHQKCQFAENMRIYREKEWNKKRR